MKLKTNLTILGLITVCWLSNIQAEIKSEQIEYQIDGQSFSGYLSYDDAVTGKRPGILVVHEWWGHNDYARKRADMLAKLGYTAFALDMYGKGKLAQHPEQAKTFMQSVINNMAVAEQRFNAAKKLLQQQPTVDKQQLAAIGYCFGGGVVLHMAKQDNDLDAVVSFHGSLAPSSPAQKDSIKARILVFNGADDTFITAEQITAFKKDMQIAGADYEFMNYPGVKHGFTNPAADDFGQRFDMPLAYNTQADQDSWQRMKSLFEQIFTQ